MGFNCELGVFGTTPSIETKSLTELRSASELTEILILHILNT